MLELMCFCMRLFHVQEHNLARAEGRVIVIPNGESIRRREGKLLSKYRSSAYACKNWNISGVARNFSTKFRHSDRTDGVHIRGKFQRILKRSKGRKFKYSPVAEGNRFQLRR